MVNREAFLKGFKGTVWEGLRSAWNFNRQATDSLSAASYPEYLTSVLVGQKLLEWGEDAIPSAPYIVQLERQVNYVASRCFKSPPVIGSKKMPTRSGKPGKGRERFDVVLYEPGQGLLELTRAVVEIKDFKASPSPLKRDLGRLQLLLDLADDRIENACLIGAVTFFLLDKRSVGKVEAQKFITRRRKKLETLAASYNSPTIAASLLLRTVGLPPDPGDPDDDARHVVGGVIWLARRSAA